MLGVGLDLASQAGDADVDAAIVGGPVAIPGDREDLIAGQRTVRALDEHLEQLEFHRGQGQLGAVQIEELSGIEIELAASRGDASLT